MACAAERAGEALTLLDSEVTSEQHIAGIEQAHWLVMDDYETILSEIVSPPLRTEQPQLRNDIAAFAMAPLQQSASDISRASVP